MQDPRSVLLVDSGLHNAGSDPTSHLHVMGQVLITEVWCGRVLGQMQEPPSLVLRREYGHPLAAKPNFASLLRCRWPPEASFTSQEVPFPHAHQPTALACFTE